MDRLIDLQNPVVRLCIAGTEAEFRGKMEDACSLYQQAWLAVSDDFDACIAAHYLARCQSDPQQRLYWNRVALEKADAVGGARVKEFYPSLYLNLGQSYELLGDLDAAQRFFDLAAELGIVHEG